MNVPYLDVRAGNIQLRDELQLAYARVVNSGRYVLGEELERFEEDFASFCATRHAIGVGNGLDALTIALRASDIGPGDEVIVPAHTFIATWLAVIECGARVVPVDIEPDRMLIDPDAVTAACTRHTAAIIPVHLYGRPVDPAPLEELARRHSLIVIGDAAQAHGAAASGRSVGEIGNAATFSFYPAKNLGGIGDGGAITTNDDALAARARRLRNYGSLDRYEFAEFGRNSRLDPLQAAFLGVKLRVLPEWNARRTRIAERYRRELDGVRELVLPACPGPNTVHAWHTFSIRHPRRDHLRTYLGDRGVETQLHYPVPPYRSAAFAHLKLEPGDYPATEAVTGTVLSLPIGPHLDDASVEFVIETVGDFDSQ